MLLTGRMSKERSPESEHHQSTGEWREGATHAHLVAAESNGKQDHQTGHEHSRHELEHSWQAHEQEERTRRNLANGSRSAFFRHDEVAALAHALWQARGCPEGSPDEDWFQASRQLRLRQIESHRKETSKEQNHD